MQAYIIEQFGDPDVFQARELPQPEVNLGQVLIRVMATSVNPVDCKIRSGKAPQIAPDFPAVLHGDVAGVIEAVGTDVTEFQPGDEVYGCAGGVKGYGGALAEFMVADVSLIARKPKSLNWQQAAALPLVSITAWEGLIDRAKVRPQQKVLVYGGTGGVGHLGVQLAKWAGATVYATVSDAEKAQLANQLGADYVINYRQQSVEAYIDEYTNGKGFDVVFDTVGNDHLSSAFQAAALNGTVVSTVARSSPDLSLLHAKGLTLHLVFMLIPMLHKLGKEHHGEILTQLVKAVDEGQVKPLVDRHTFTLAEVAAAHRLLESGKAIGKVTLTVNNEQ
ncbi:zinc-dependent alcohol dehydrogenase family protein [Myxosarcina sp. GI1]|uniref:zinc-dependent alcohol dehydrogenase family protein n=1 Tax=Myxosarcina sp. GI1 TaxID=1541065 RepID=UPI00055E461D|nr:zinc-dependent alcohol dehydrogenase family protein [Myxosarcina sp. GI1]